MDDDMPQRGRFRYREEKHGMRAAKPKFPRVTPDSSDSGKSGSDSSDNGDNSQSDSGDSNSDSESDEDTTKKPAKAAALCVKNLSTRTSDHSLQEALFHEFKKVGDIIYIRVFGSGEQRYAVVKFRNGVDAEKAMVNNSKMFLGQEMKLLPWKLDEKEDDRASPAPRVRSKVRHYSNPVEELGYDPQATRTLFVGNLEKTLTHSELKRAFDKFGDIVDVDIKKQDRGITTYAFIQFIDVGGAMRGKKRMDRQFVGRNRVKVGYGRGTPTNTIWVGNLTANVSESQLQRQFNVFGFITKILIDREFVQALIWFETIDSATVAFTQTRGKFVHGKRLTVDFASRSCKEGFYSRMELSGQLDRRDLEPSPPPRPSYNTGSGGNNRPGYNRRGSGGGSNYEQRGGRGSFGSRFGRSGSAERDYTNTGDSFYGGNSGSYGNNMQDEDYDDYERELRDYGYRQKERERERGRKPERGPRENQDRGYSPLSDEEQQKLPPRSSRDSRSPLSGRNDDGSYTSDRDGKYSSRRMNLKRKHPDEELYGGSPSPSRVESVVMKVDRTKKRKKEKLIRRKAQLSMEVEGEFGAVSNEDVDEDSILLQERLAKLERMKKKKKLSLEKAEEKARRKELKRLKRLKKMRSMEGLVEAEQELDKDTYIDDNKDSSSMPANTGEGGDDELSDVAIPSKQGAKHEKTSEDEMESGGFPISKEPENGGDGEEGTTDNQDASVDAVMTEGDGAKTPVDTPASPSFDAELTGKDRRSISPVSLAVEGSNRLASDIATGAQRLSPGPSTPSEHEPRTPPTPNLDEDSTWHDGADDEPSSRRRANEKDYVTRYKKEDEDELDSDRGAYFDRQRREKGPKTPPSHADDISRGVSPGRQAMRDRRSSKDNFGNKIDSKRRDESNYREGRDGGRDVRTGYARGSGSEYREEWRDRSARDSGRRERVFDRYESKPRDRDDRQPSRDRMRFRRSPSPRGNDVRQRSPPMRYRGSDQMDKRGRSPQGHKSIHSPDFSRGRESPDKSRYDKRMRGRMSPVSSDKEREMRQKGYGHHSQARGHDGREHRDYGRRHERGAGVREDSPPPPPPPPPSKHDAHATGSAASSSVSSHHKTHDMSGATSQYQSSGAAAHGSGVSGGSAVASPAPSNQYTLLDLLRRYPVMWQGIFALKHNSAAIQMHYLSGNVRIAEASLPQGNQPGEVPPPLTISQRMKLEPSQLDGVNKRIQVPKDHCLLLALPCGRDPLDVHAQTRALKSGFISYLQEKQAAGIINVNHPTNKQTTFVLHIFPPCDFAQSHLAKVAPDLLDSAADSGHLMVLVTTS